MNFVLHEKDLKKLLTTAGGKAYAGCYVYKRDEDDKTKKIGMSQAGLFRRIKQAKACYPYKTEFWVEYIIISLDGHYTKGEKSTTRYIENALHTESKHLSTVEIQKEDAPEQGKRPREYRLLSTDVQMQNLLKKTLNKHRDKWDYILCFSKGGWHIVPNDRVVAIPITSLAQLKPKQNAAMPAIHSLPLNKTKLVLPKDLKAKDVVPASENWGKFIVVRVISKKHIVATFPPSKKQYDIKL
jgi:hypothetical protein